MEVVIRKGTAWKCSSLTKVVATKPLFHLSSAPERLGLYPKFTMKRAAEKHDLIDPYGRTVRDLRISVTDRCNFRCQYCMPAEGMTWLPRNELLTFEEIERFARVCVEHFGFDGIRLTGGEPLVRAHLPKLVERLASLEVNVALTTNGATLRLHAQSLADAGLSRINISLDSLQRDRFLELTRRDELDRVLDGIDAAI